jgi:hypothetical protein
MKIATVLCARQFSDEMGILVGIEKRLSIKLNL